MDERKYVQKLLEISKKYELQKENGFSYDDTHAPFIGTPKKHPKDDNILILLTSPFSNDKKFYEFPLNSIGNVEDLGIITSSDGRTATKIKVWVKKGMPGLMAQPFIVK